MDPLEHLAELFSKFPGIGPRQAGRFVQYLLRSSPILRRELSDSIRELSGSVHQCPECMRFFSGSKGVCGLCANPKRDKALLAVVANDTDLLALERSGTYKGQYFVLGGTISLASEKTSGLRVHELVARIEALNPREIILAFPANPEGDATSVRMREEITDKTPTRTVTTLGRGLSTGSELEYADADTLKSAFDNRK